MTTLKLSIENVDDDFIKSLKEFLKSKSHFHYKLQEKHSIPLLDEAIREYEKGEVVTCANFEEYKAKINE